LIHLVDSVSHIHLLLAHVTVSASAMLPTMNVRVGPQYVDLPYTRTDVEYMYRLGSRLCQTHAASVTVQCWHHRGGTPLEYALYLYYKQ